ncbi:MAG: hypothetical protein WC379_10760 [Methanoregula sp.]|jgi:hypothetical protein
MNYQYQKAIAVLVLIAIVVGVVAIIALVVNTFICNNCLLGGGGQVQPIPVKGSGLISLDSPDETPVYSSFEEMKSQFGEMPGLARDNSSHSHVYFMQGQNLDENGWAEKWLFEVKTTDGTGLGVYDRHGWTIMPWNVPHTMEDINIDTVISPSALFRQSSTLILQNSSVSSAPSREIELRGNVYTLTITSEKASAVMKFDATTGALIE